MENHHVVYLFFVAKYAPLFTVILVPLRTTKARFGTKPNRGFDYSALMDLAYSEGEMPKLSLNWREK